MRKGPPMTGIRWHNSYDSDYARTVVERKIQKIIGMQAVKWIDVDIVSHISGPRIESKPLD
jgi:hypothetical protein